MRHEVQVSISRHRCLQQDLWKQSTQGYVHFETQTKIFVSFHRK